MNKHINKKPFSFYIIIAGGEMKLRDHKKIVEELPSLGKFTEIILLKDIQTTILWKK